MKARDQGRDICQRRMVARAIMTTLSLDRSQTGNQSWPFFSKTSCQSWRKPEPKLLYRSICAVKRTASPCRLSFHSLWGDRSSVRAAYDIRGGSSERDDCTRGKKATTHKAFPLCTFNTLLFFGASIVFWGFWGGWGFCCVWGFPHL